MDCFSCVATVPCAVHAIKHNCLEVTVLFAVQQQVNLGVSYSELVAQINLAPIEKSSLSDWTIRLPPREVNWQRSPDTSSLFIKDGKITHQEYGTTKAGYEQRLADIPMRLTDELANGADQKHPAPVAVMKLRTSQVCPMKSL